MLYFENLFKFPTLVEKLFDRGIKYLGTVRSDWKNMAIMKKGKDMKRGDIDFQYANNVIAVKWFENRRVTMVGTCLEECNKVSTVTRRVKGIIPVDHSDTSVPRISLKWFCLKKLICYQSKIT